VKGKVKRAVSFVADFENAALLERPGGALELLAVGSAALSAGTVFVEAVGRAGRARRRAPLRSGE
jgi:hypothetical protein